MPPYRPSPALVAIQDAFKQIVDVPYCTGTVKLDARQSLLFYRAQGKSRYVPRFIDFANPSETQLTALDKACSPASFGQKKQSALDENYRNIGEMDSADFSAQFSPSESNIFKKVVDALFNLKTSESVANVKYELYKLNVYGPGSFFRHHGDTPRSDTMFGSLVVILPTPHTGGSMLFRQRGTKYTFDSAKAVSDSSADTPHAAFAAFFTDVEHEVTKVTSGYRVTLTYNLYHTSRNPSDGLSGITIQNETLSRLRATLASLLSSPKFLPDGGLLVFELANEYLFKPQPSTKLSDIGKQLKGFDALLVRACDALKLEASLKALYSDSCAFNSEVFSFMDKFVPFNGLEMEEELVELFRESYWTETITGYDALSGTPAPTDDYDEDIVGVVWAKPLENRNVFKERYANVCDGYKPTVAWAYGMVCLAVRIKPASERT